MLWKWKLGRDLDEVLHLLNGETRYDRPVPDARVCMAWRGDHPTFWVFARKAAKSRVPHDGLGCWRWKLALDADDVQRFLRGEDTSAPMAAEVQIAAAWTGNHLRFHVFYRTAIPGRREDPVPADWRWRRLEDPEEAVGFLNGEDSDEGPVTEARIATVHRDRHAEFFVFYQRSDGPDREMTGGWRWHPGTSPDEVRRIVERKGSPPLDFQVGAPPVGYGVFQVFTTPPRQADPAGPVEARLCLG
ncbi:MAG: hypothetical protein QG622_2297 [Actinomycetota bacterium]|nr:hypothetical protein [Actinomycetota bacterium]